MNEVISGVDVDNKNINPIASYGIEPYEVNDTRHLHPQGKIILRTLEGYHIVCIKNIMYCKSDGNYTTFYLPEEKIMISKPLKKIESMINQEIFFRCHQSYIVNLSFIKKYNHEGTLILKGGTELPVASRRKEVLLERIFKLF